MKRYALPILLALAALAGCTPAHAPGRAPADGGFGAAARAGVPRLPDFPTLARLPVFDVRKYGAKGDGTTDDTAALQAALDAARTAGGATILFPKGAFAITGELRYGSKTIIQGTGPGTTTIKWLTANAAAGYVLIAHNDSASDVVVRDLTIDHNRVARGVAVDQTNAAINVVGTTRLTLENLHIKDTVSAGVVGVGVTDCRIRGVTFTDTGHHCIYFAGDNSGLWVEDCTLNTPHADADGVFGGNLLKLRTPDAAKVMQNIWFVRNKCGRPRGPASPRIAVYMEGAGTYRNVHIEGNTFNKDRDAGAGTDYVAAYLSSNTFAHGVRFVRNDVYGPGAAVSGGSGVTLFQGPTAADRSGVRVDGNRIEGMEYGILAIYDGAADGNEFVNCARAFSGQRSTFSRNRVRSTVADAYGGYFPLECNVTGNDIDLTGAAGTTFGVRYDTTTDKDVSGNVFRGSTYGQNAAASNKVTGCAIANTYDGVTYTTPNVLADSNRQPGMLVGQWSISNIATSDEITFTDPMPDTLYRVYAVPCVLTGTPAAGSWSVKSIVKTETGFTISVEAAPGSGNNVTGDYVVHR